MRTQTTKSVSLEIDIGEISELESPKTDTKQSIASSISPHDDSVDMKHKDEYDFIDELAQLPSFWDGFRGSIAFKLILIGSLVSLILNLVLCFYLAEYRHILVLFPLTEIMDSIQSQEMNFIIIVSLFGITFIGVYITIDMIKNNVAVLRSVSIVIMTCPLFGFRSIFWIINFIPCYNNLDSAIYKYIIINSKKHKHPKITLIAIYHYIMNALNKYREKQFNQLHSADMTPLEYQRIANYLNNKLNENYNQNITQMNDIIEYIEHIGKYKYFLLKIILYVFIIAKEVSLFRILWLKGIIFNFNDWLCVLYIVSMIVNVCLIVWTYIWSCYNERNKIRRDRILLRVQQYDWSDGYMLLCDESFTQSKFINEFDLFYDKWAASYWHYYVRQILVDKYVHNDILSIIFEYV